MLTALYVFNIVLDTRQIAETIKELNEDLTRAREYMGERDTQFARRTALRTCAALMEGVVHQATAFAIQEAENDPSLFSAEDILILREVSVSLNQKGEIEERANFQKLKPKLIHSVRCFLRVFDQEYSPDTSLHGWEALGQFLKIRNRLMHPRNIDDLFVSDEDFEISKKANDWFGDTFAIVFGLSKNNYETTYNKKRNEMDGTVVPPIR